MKDIKDEIKERLCEYCDLDGMCLIKEEDKPCEYRYNPYGIPYCQKFKDYIKSPINSIIFEIKMLFHKPTDD